MNEYKVRLYSKDGVLQSEITDFQKIAYTKEVNKPGILTLDLAGSNLSIPYAEKTGQFEVWRRPEEQVWYRDFIGIIRKFHWYFKDYPIITYTCPGILDMLRWRWILFYANTLNRTKFVGVKAETIANTLVKYNATTFSTIGRLRVGTISGLSVEADGAEGTAMDWFCAYDNLLTSLQKLCQPGVGGGDFDIVKLTPTTYQWRWYTGQLGTDRTSSVVFSMGYGNMADPVYDEDYIPESTAAFVGGKGEDSARAYQVVTGANYDASYNNTEIFVNGNNIDTDAGLIAEGQSKLASIQTKPNFQFTVLQTPKCLYGVHYFLGDLVKAINPYNGMTYTHKVQKATVGIEKGGGDTVDVELSCTSMSGVGVG